MKPLRVIGLSALVGVLGLIGFGVYQAAAFDASMSRVYPIAPPAIEASSDPAVIERGRHLAQSIGGCTGCHGPDLGGKAGDPIGPLGRMYAPNLTAGPGGVAARYNPRTLARLIRDGVKADGRSLKFMPSQDLSWLPDEDLAAIASYVFSCPPVDRGSPPSEVRLMGKLLDRTNQLPIDIARRIDHSATRPKQLSAAPTAEYGQYLARGCQGCHGANLSGGRIPGAPPELAVPSNITPHATGIAHYTEADFMRLLDTGVRPNGKRLDPFMPIESLRALNPTERRALFAYLMSRPPRSFGGR